MGPSLPTAVLDSTAVLCREPESPSMRRQSLGAWALAAALSVPAHADEPYKPTASASEANPAVPAAGHSIHGEAFNEGPRQAAVILPGMGKIDFRVTTTKPEA